MLVRRILFALLAVAACGTTTPAVVGAGASVTVPRREFRMRFPEVKCEDQHDDANLEQLCKRDHGVCACGMFGMALQSEPSREREGIVLLDDACVHGYLEACDSAALVAELCVLRHSPGCDDLAEQGRIKIPRDDDGMGQATLPFELRSCWIVGSIDGSIGFAAPIGTTVCFDNDRVSWHAPGAPWDQEDATWTGYPGVGIFRPSVLQQGRLRREGGVLKYGSATLERAPESITREARALPSIKEVCGRAWQCRSRVAARLRPPSTGDEGSEEPYDFPRTLRSCRELEQRIRAKYPDC
jgi:hypothetical protein